MRLLIDNIKTEVIIGGKDNLLPFDLYKELDKYLAVDVPGAYFARKSGAMKGWDGKRHFLTGNKFPTGFLPLVLNFCNEQGVKVEALDQRKDLPIFKEAWQFKFDTFELREDQQTLLKKCKKELIINSVGYSYPRGILDAATNAGKTKMMVALALNLVNAKILITIHSDLVYNDLKIAFSEYFEIGEITSKKYEIKNVTIAMVKSLYSKASQSINVINDLKQFNTVFVDEAHRAGGKQYAEILQLIPAGCRIFVSGTPLDSSNKINNLIAIGICGPVLGVITNKELIDNKVSRRPIVYFHRVVINTRNRKKLFTYIDEKELLINHCQERLQKVYNIIDRDKEKSTLIAFIEMEAGRNIYHKISSIPGQSIEVIHGTSGGTKQKLSIIKRFIEGVTSILIGSTVLQEGINMPNIQRLILYTGGKSLVRLLQFIGRALRANGEDTVEVHDFFDDDGDNLRKHSKKRLKLYKSEGFECFEVIENLDGTTTLKKL